MSLVLTQINPAFINRNVYLKVQFINLPTPDGIIKEFNTILNTSKQDIIYNYAVSGRVNINKFHYNGTPLPNYYKDKDGNEYLIFVLNVSTKFETTVSVTYSPSLDKTKQITSNSLNIFFTSSMIGTLSPSIDTNNLINNVNPGVFPSIEIRINTLISQDFLINTPVNIIIELSNISKLISIIGSDNSIVPVNFEKNSLGDITALITSSTVGPVTYTITGNSDIGIISSNSITITFSKQLTIPTCPNSPGELVTFTLNRFLNQFNKIRRKNGVATEDWTSKHILEMYDQIPFGLPKTDEGFVYCGLSVLLLFYGISSSRICNVKITPSIVNIDDMTDVTISFIITDRITPDNNFRFRNQNNSNNSNDYLSYSCVINWLKYHFRNSDDLNETVTLASKDNGVFPLSLQSDSCRGKNSPSIAHFTGTILNKEDMDIKEDIDIESTSIKSASEYIKSNTPSNSSSNTSSSNTPNNSSSNTSSSNSNDSSGTTIIIVVVVVVIILAGGGYYYMTMKSKNYELTAGRFNIGE
jgi:hypothetical protein